METQLKDYMEVDWTSFSQRKSLVRVRNIWKNCKCFVYMREKVNHSVQKPDRKYYMKIQDIPSILLQVFLRTFPGIQSWEDFEKADFQEVQEDRGTTRINRVYRQLAVCRSCTGKGMMMQMRFI